MTVFHLSNRPESLEWYTPPEITYAARRVLGRIDLDPSSCALANTLVRAARYYTKDEDGLTKPWYGRMWLNPPVRQRLWWERLVREWQAGRVEVAVYHMYNNEFLRRGQASPVPPQHFPHLIYKDRVKGWGPNGENRRPPVASACVLVGGGRETVERFLAEFSRFGVVCKRL